MAEHPESKIISNPEWLDWSDIGYRARISQQYEAVMDFRVEHTEENRAMHGVALSGTIKWDGCVDWRFQPERDHDGMHFCGPEDVVAFTRMLRRIYDVAMGMFGEGDGLIGGVGADWCDKIEEDTKS